MGFLEIFFIKNQTFGSENRKNIFDSFFGLDWMTKFRAISRVFLIDWDDLFQARPNWITPLTKKSTLFWKKMVLKWTRRNIFKLCQATHYWCSYMLAIDGHHMELLLRELVFFFFGWKFFSWNWWFIRNLLLRAISRISF